MKEFFHVHATGASQQDIQDVLAVLHHGLPFAYTALLAETNGAESGIHDKGGDCLRLWSTYEIVQLNHDYQIDRWLPDVLAIGDNGGGDAIVLDMSASPEPDDWPVVQVGLGDLDRASFQALAINFQQWIEHGFRLVSSTNIATNP
jgi:hypothetical protein